MAGLAGCGGMHHSAKSLTVPGYGEHPATTIALTHGSPAFCRGDAGTFAQDALLFIGHSGPNASYPADLYYIDLREVFYDFQAHSCAPSYLAPPLTKRLTAAQRRKLVADLPQAMAATVRAGLAHSSG